MLAVIIAIVAMGLNSVSLRLSVVLAVVFVSTKRYPFLPYSFRRPNDPAHTTQDEKDDKTNKTGDKIQWDV